MQTVSDGLKSYSWDICVVPRFPLSFYLASPKEQQGFESEAHVVKRSSGEEVFMAETENRKDLAVIIG
jgi:hypothetical protein